MFDSITNRGEYFSEHYLDSVITGDLRALRKRWNEAEGKGEVTPRSGLFKLRPALEGVRADLHDEVEGAERRAADLVLAALGFKPEPVQFLTTRGEGTEVLVPLAARSAREGSPPDFIALAASFTTDIDRLFERKGDEAEPVRLLDPVVMDGEAVTEPSRAISLIFDTDDHPPRHILLVAGATVLLASRGKWTEGRYLAADLDLALSRADTRANGELETIAALFGADTLMSAGEAAEPLIDELDAHSTRNAAGVSEDLREGVRLAVEEIANEVIKRRLETNKAVYSETDFAGRITREALRFLYRILFLLYAEARPDLDVVPVLAEGYATGYGLDRLRELALEEPQEEASRGGTHIYDSLDLLFRLVNDGHRHRTDGGTDPNQAGDDTGFIFNPLESDLFDPAATPLIGSVGMSNLVLCRILARLLLTREGTGNRGFVSYSALGINQLGAVYEQLMAYTGFLADEDLFEIRESGSKGGTWVVPVGQADDFPDDAFVTAPDPHTGEENRVRHSKGTFVFRLSGRQRQRSASYYTPEILTEFVVRHALDELLDQDGQKTAAAEILELTICEPALGSGAFLNEAITQLSTRYLARIQEETGEVIDPEDYPSELQKVKAHFALHQAYGVDLNATAVELAEVSLWLNAMHPGLKAPWFGLHLRRGNSLVGARRSVYTAADLPKRAWLKTVPTDRKLADGRIRTREIHSFLLPAEGWGAAAKTKEAKELEPEAARNLNEWAKRVKKGPKQGEAGRLAGLARRVEALWELAVERLEAGERDLRRNLGLYGDKSSAPTGSQDGGDLATRRAVEAALEDEQSALARLRLAMDAWCALWFWPVAETPPEWEEWLQMLEALLGVDPDDGSSIPEAPSIFDLPAIDQREQLEQERFGMLDLTEVNRRFSWLETIREIGDREGFFHWELEFGHVMKRGGFDLQVGNPPWVRPRWLDDQILADLDPWFGLHGGSSAGFTDRRAELLAAPQPRRTYLLERASGAALTGFLSSPVLYPALDGIQTNLYMVFMPQTWNHAKGSGVVGMLHQEGHFVEPKAGPLRRETYPRLRRHWHYVNEAKVFPEVDHHTDFSVNVYGEPQSISFLSAANLQLPPTLDRSIDHDGSGVPPGIKTPDGQWDRRPHASRIMDIDCEVLAGWVKLFDEPGTPPEEARLMRPHTQEDLGALAVLAKVDRRLGDYEYRWTSGWHEKGRKRDGTMKWSTEIPTSWDEVILQGPHIAVANPFAKQPNEGCKNNLDWSAWDLEELPERVIPRTNYQRACDRERYDADAPHWDGRPAASEFRVMYRRFVGTGGVRSLQAAVIPPGPLHVNVNHSMAIADRTRLVDLSGLWSSVPLDYLFKSTGQGNLYDVTASRFPFPDEADEPLAYMALRLRSLRLNCLIADYASLWEGQWQNEFASDTWTTGDRRLSVLASPREWTMDTPLRGDLERRQALVEIDALSALILGLTADQLCAMYRTQFGVLRKYEWFMRHDQNGREVPKEIWTGYEEKGEEAELGRYVPPFTKPDREAEMRQAYAEFERRAQA